MVCQSKSTFCCARLEWLIGGRGGLMWGAGAAALGRPINSAALRCNTKHVFTRSLMGQEGRRGFLFTCHRWTWCSSWQLCTRYSQHICQRVFSMCKRESESERCRENKLEILFTWQLQILFALNAIICKLSISLQLSIIYFILMRHICLSIS